MATMKAVRMYEYGGPEVLVHEDMPRPEPSANEILIRVRAAGVNPVDWKFRDGVGREFFGHQLPLILGCDLAGVVDSTGADVKGISPGDAVYGYVNLGRCGAYAEYAIGMESEVTLKPQALEFTEAAAVPVCALTSWQALFDIAELKTDQKVLIHAAAGGVGHMAVQLAKARGAVVIGTASAKNAEFVRSLGSDEVIDYRTTRFEDVVKNVDVVFDTIGDETQKRSFQVLKRGGMIVSAVSEPPEKACKTHGVKGAMVLVQPNSTQLAEITTLIESGKLKPAITAILPLDDARKAHEMSQTGHTQGKIILTV